MKTGLQEAMASGVFVEFCDAEGHCIGQAVYDDWRGRPVPAVGDDFCCLTTSPRNRRRRKLLGKVCARKFNVQTDDTGATLVWVQLQVATEPAVSPARRPSRSTGPMFSVN